MTISIPILIAIVLNVFPLGLVSGTSVEGDGSSKPRISIAAEIDAYPYVQSSQMTTLDGRGEIT